MRTDLEEFIRQAMGLGFGARLVALTESLDTAIEQFPKTGHPSYLARLYAQRDRLANPDLRLIASVLNVMYEEDRRSLATLQPLLKRLVVDHPYLSVLDVNEDPSACASQDEVR